MIEHSSTYSLDLARRHFQWFTSTKPAVSQTPTSPDTSTALHERPRWPITPTPLPMFSRRCMRRCLLLLHQRAQIDNELATHIAANEVLQWELVRIEDGFPSVVAVTLVLLQWASRDGTRGSLCQARCTLCSEECYEAGGHVGFSHEWLSRQVPLDILIPKIIRMRVPYRPQSS